MAFRAAVLVMALDGDPLKHRTTIKTPRIELTTVLAELWNFDQIASTCKELVDNEGVQSIILCPGCTHEAVAKVANAVGKGVAVSVARGDVPSTMLTGEILGKEGWLPGHH